MLQFLITYKNLMLQLSLSLTLTLLLTFLKVPVFFLRGLHPDNAQSGVRAAIRHPDGAAGLVLGNVTCFTFSPKFVDFHLSSVDGFGKMFIAVLMGWFSGFLFIPAVKSARCFWLGTDQIRYDLVMLSCDWFGRVVLYVNYMMIAFTVLLIGNVGFSPSDFGKFRIWCLLASSLLQIVALRPNIQMYLNEALLSWYQRLHASRVPDLDFSRAKVFLHNHYLCLVVLQFLGPPIVSLLLLGLSQIDGISWENYQYICSLAPCSAFVKEVALFMAWWIPFVWTIYSSATIFLYRRCILYMS